MKCEKTVVLKDGTPCTIRSAKAEDAREVLRSFLTTHGETENLTSYPDECTFTAESEAEFLENAEKSSREAELVAVIGGRIAATAGISAAGRYDKVKHRADFGISVEKAYWGNGVGKALTAACIELAKQAGYKRIELEVVSANTAAVRLYDSFGFVTYGLDTDRFIKRDGEPQQILLMRLGL